MSRVSTGEVSLKTVGSYKPALVKPIWQPHTPHILYWAAELHKENTKQVKLKDISSLIELS